MLDSEFFYLFFPFFAFYTVGLPICLYKWKRKRENSSSKPIIMYVRYPDHTVEEVQEAVGCNGDVANAVRGRLTAKLAAEPDADVSSILVYWLMSDNYWELKLFSVSQNPAGVLTLCTAVSSSIDFDWDHKTAALKNPDVQLDAICALGCRLQDAK